MIIDNLRSGQPRVLVVENDLHWRQDHLTNLARWGYRPFLAQGQGPALLQDAIDKATLYRCHVALVDMRLLDDTHDSSGLDLVPKLKPTRSIMVSGYSPGDIVQIALTEKGADDFINKGEGRKLLKRAIESSLVKSSASKKGIQIEWPDNYSPEMVISAVFPKALDRGVPSDEVNDLLGLLFPNAKRLQLQALSDLAGKSRFVPQVDSVLLMVYVDDLVQPEVVKIARAKEIEDEYKRYQDHVKDKLARNYYTPIEKCVSLWDIGAVKYDLGAISTPLMPTFTQYYQSTDSSKAIATPLFFVFDQLSKNYYRKAGKSSRRSLFEAYSDVWGANWYKRLQNFSPQETHLEYSTLRRKLLNPIGWVLDRIAVPQKSHPATSPPLTPPNTRGGTGNSASIEGIGAQFKVPPLVLGGVRGGLAEMIPLTPETVTHGNLHGDNLLVGGWRARLINYERTGLRPILQDFVKLEVHILTQLADFKPSELPAFFKLAIKLVDPTSAQQIDPTALSDHQEAHKALRVIKALRQLAEQNVDPFDQRLYLWSLLFESLYVVTSPELDAQELKGQRQRALLLGSLICHRLQKWEESEFNKKALKYRDTLARYTPQTFPRECHEAAYSLGCLFYDAERFAEAREAFEVGHEAIQGLWTEVLSGEEKGRLGGQNADLYGRLVHCCVLLGDDEAAFEYGVAGKRRKVLDSLASEGFDLFTAVENNPTVAKDPKWDEYRQLLEEINGLRATLRRQMGMPPRPALTHSMQKKLHDQLHALVAQQNTLWQELALNYPTLTATQQTPRFTLQQARRLAEDLSQPAD